MQTWLKRILALLIVPFLALVLTACPDNGATENGDSAEPAAEDANGVEGEDENGEEDAED